MPTDQCCTSKLTLGLFGIRSIVERSSNRSFEGLLGFAYLAMPPIGDVAASFQRTTRHQGLDALTEGFEVAGVTRNHGALRLRRVRDNHCHLRPVGPDRGEDDFVEGGVCHRESPNARAERPRRSAATRAPPAGEARWRRSARARGWAAPFHIGAFLSWTRAK
jgi:hypothetical protein